MDFFKNIYRTTPRYEETLSANISEPLFRYADMLGGAVSLRSDLVGNRLGHRGRKGIVNDAFRLAFYHLVASRAILVKVQHFDRVYFGNLTQASTRVILERNPDFPGYDELESPLCAAIYSACDGKKLSKVVKLVLNGYMGPGTEHDQPLTVLFSALLQGEMRGWRLSRQTTSWGFFRQYEFSSEDGHDEILAEAFHSGLKGLSELLGNNGALYAVGEDFRRRVFQDLSMRKRHEHHHHYPKHPRHRKPRRRKKRKRDEDPRMWTEN